MKFTSTNIPDVFLVQSNYLADSRGGFLKIWHEPDFQRQFPKLSIREIYCSHSQRGVIRGLHYQVPPHDHAKIIFCLRGNIFDACVDLRKSSSTYGQHAAVELNGKDGRGLVVPSGFAHGLQALTDDTIIVNASSHEYEPLSERGIAWDSCGIRWPVANPILSDKDRTQPRLASIESQFS